METENQNNNSRDDRKVYCDCSTSILERIDNRKFDIIKNHGGQKGKLTIEYSGDRFEVECKKCRRHFTFTTDKTTGRFAKGLRYVIAGP